MKRFLSTVAMVCAAMTAMAQPSFTVGSYNIRYENTGDAERGDAWDVRSQAMFDLLEYEGWDIFGAQEVLVDQLHDILDNVEGYDYIGVAREDGKEDGEFAPIFYRKDRMNCLDKGWFWISETPEVVGSIGWDADQTRICTWGYFEDDVTKWKFWFFNLHMDHRGIAARREGAKLVLAKIKEMCGNDPYILTGDFNVDQNNEAYKMFIDSGAFVDTYESATHRMAQTGTTNSFRADHWTGSRIDHILVSPLFKTHKYGVLTYAYWSQVEGQTTERGRPLYQARMLSDHYPVAACVELPAMMAPEKAQECVYTDASVFPLYGQINDDVETRYERLPLRLKDVSRPDILRLGRKSAGMFLRFRSNTTSVWVKWAALYDNEQNHMTDTGTRGLDLYALVDGEWKAVAPVRPENTGLNECRVIRNMEPVEREYMLYLPLYDGIKSLEIGVDPDAFIDQPAVDSPSTEKPIVMYGSSILQGGCASRPGMAYTNILGREFDRVVYNLGFSGNARLDMEIAELMAEVEDPGAFVLDYVPNTPYTLIEEAGEKFFRILRDAHPDVPVIFVEDPIFPRSEFDKKLQQEVLERNPTQYRLYRKLKKAGEKNLYYVSADKMLGDDGEATADGSHFTDLGMMRYVENIMPIMKKALK